MELILILWLLCGVFAAVSATGKGINGCGAFLLGFLLGPIGLAIILIMKGDGGAPAGSQPNETAQVMRKCLGCGDSVALTFRHCPGCGAAMGGPARH